MMGFCCLVIGVLTGIVITTFYICIADNLRMNEYEKTIKELKEALYHERKARRGME